jgi:hypothetical protein
MQVSDDLSFWNVDFCQVERSFTLARINALEVAVLEALKFNVAVGASEYGKYYFALRQMSAKSEQISSKDKDSSSDPNTIANHHIPHVKSDGDSGIYDGSAYDDIAAVDKLSPSKAAARSSTTSLEQLHDTATNTATTSTTSSGDDTTQFVPSVLQNAEPIGNSSSSNNNSNSSSGNSSNSKAQLLAPSDSSAGATRAAAWSVKP